MSVAVLVPGQGLDLIGVASAWYAASVESRRLLDLASAQVQLPVPRLLHGAGLALRQTQYYQPVMTALCCGILHEIEQRTGTADVTLGHSLGELVACVAAGILTSDDAVAAAVLRGRLMARESSSHPGGMLALQATLDAALAAVAVAATIGRVCIAALNAHDQQVVSGDHAALRAIPARCAPQMLATDGAWHSPAMAGAVDEFRRSLDVVCMPLRRARWIANRTGAFVTVHDHPPALLAAQLTQPVQWVRSLETLAASGVDCIIIVGPAKAQRTLARRTVGPGMRFLSVELPEDLTLLEQARVA